jgi:hypothetical protein
MSLAMRGGETPISFTRVGCTIISTARCRARDSSSIRSRLGLMKPLREGMGSMPTV